MTQYVHGSLLVIFDFLNKVTEAKTFNETSHLLTGKEKQAINRHMLI